MSKYSCKCPAPGCGFVMDVSAGSWDKAFKKMYTEGGRHIIDNHPDFPEVDEERAYEYAKKNMKLK